MVDWSSYYYERERYENLRREADQYRLSREGLPRHAKGAGLASRVLIYLRCQLTTLGHRLMKQQGGTVEVNVPCEARSVV